jgi:hypothetical protein
MPDGKVYVPLDLRGFRKEREPIAFTLDEEEEPVCVTLDVFTDSVHAQVKLDDAAMDLLFEKVIQMRLQLTERRAFQKGAAHGARRKGGREK